MVSTVSTRGVKFKFSEGEKVLCYEPDPTKAKVLYDSKVLELNVSRDNRGRKVPEYLIHFFGWSSSWDRCVKEEFILQDTEENRVLQAKLAQEAAAYLKGKRKSKLPQIIKESLLKKESEESTEPEAMVKTEDAESSESSDSSDEECERNIQIKMPDPLKDKLVDDAIFVTMDNMLIRLPCECNVVSILEDYVKHLAVQLLSPQDKDSKTGKIMSISFIKSKIDFAKEVMDGIRLYFDFTMSHLLLYRQEKKQFYTLGATCSPIKKSGTGNVQKSSTVSSNLDEDDTPVTPTEQARTTQSSPSAHTRGGLRNQSVGHKSPPSQRNEESGISGRKHSRGQSNKNISPPCKNLRIGGSRQGLRSRARNKSSEETASNMKADSINVPTSSDTDTSKTTHPEPVPSQTSPIRQTRRSVHNIGAPAITCIIPSTHKLQNNPKKSPSANATITASGANLVTPLSVCVCPVIAPTPASTNSSGVSSPKNEKGSAQSPLQASAIALQSSSSSTITTEQSHSSMLKEVLAWKIVPDDIYDLKPVSTSLIYGGPHLLRLFVKLPELLYKSSITKKRMGPLLQTVDDFLQYLIGRKDELVHPSLYISATQGDVVQPSHNSGRAI